MFSERAPPAVLNEIEIFRRCYHGFPSVGNGPLAYATGYRRSRQIHRAKQPFALANFRRIDVDVARPITYGPPLPYSRMDGSGPAAPCVSVSREPKGTLF